MPEAGLVSMQLAEIVDSIAIVVAIFTAIVISWLILR